MAEESSRPDSPRTGELGYREAIRRGDLLWRSRILFMLLPGSLGLLLLLGRLVATEDTLFRLNRSFGSYSFSIAVAIAFGLSTLGLMFTYLQTGLSRDRFIHDYLDHIERRRLASKQALKPSSDVEGLEPLTHREEPTSLPERKPESESKSPAAPASDRPYVEHLSSSDYETIVEKVINAAGEALFTQVSNEFTERLSADATMRRKLDYSTRETGNMIERLKEESRRLSFRGNLNLIIGIAITAIGVYALFYYVSTMKPLPDNQLAWRFMEHFVPRLSLVIFIEIFAYFFLRLYKESLADIKYYQNEITNTQSRRLAVLLSALAPSQEIMGNIIGKLANTERNFVLRKDELTPELKRIEIERATTRELLKEISAIVRAGVPGAEKSEAKEKSE